MTEPEQLNLYHLSQSVETGWDTYDSAVVVAATEEGARSTHPNGFARWEDGGWVRHTVHGRERHRSGGDWPEQVTDVRVLLIGTATPDMVRGVVCASFNAG